MHLQMGFQSPNNWGVSNLEKVPHEFPSGSWGRAWGTLVLPRAKNLTLPVASDRALATENGCGKHHFFTLGNEQPTRLAMENQSSSQLLGLVSSWEGYLGISNKQKRNDNKLKP